MRKELGLKRRERAVEGGNIKKKSEHVVVLLRYAKYCFRSINDTINQNYRDK